MQAGEYLTIALIIWILTPILALYLAKRKKRDHNFWVLTSFLFPPAVLFLSCLPVRKKPLKKMFGEDSEDDDHFFSGKD
ncbi:hypothetical protein NBRC116602_05980 [Hyphomicrobiales bacterium 4NK60-0047b]|jgi:hypothetical protein